VSVDKALQEWAAGAAVDADDLDMAKTPLGDFQVRIPPDGTTLLVSP